jgi:RNA polymerase sigma-70 factor (ECF subfamily)
MAAAFVGALVAVGGTGVAAAGACVAVAAAFVTARRTFLDAGRLEILQLSLCYAGLVNNSNRTGKLETGERLHALTEQREKFLSFLGRRVESREVAEDILHSAFLRGMESSSPVPDENLVAWFYRVLRNAVIDHYRRRAAAGRAADAWAGEFKDSHEPEVELHKQVCQCVSGLLSSLKPGYREALEVVELNGGKLTDLAGKAGITPENAAVRVHRARKALLSKVRQTCGPCAAQGCIDCDCQSGGACAGRHTGQSGR